MQTNAMPVRVLGLVLCVAGVVGLRNGSINLGACAFLLGLTVVSTAYQSKRPPTEVNRVFVKSLVIVLAMWIVFGCMVFMAARSAPVRLSSGVHRDVQKGLAAVAGMIVFGWFYWVSAAASRVGLTFLARSFRRDAERLRD
jgi:hypothetical protein